jgi:hypothetical protein
METSTSTLNNSGERHRVSKAKVGLSYSLINQPTYRHFFFIRTTSRAVCVDTYHIYSAYDVIIYDGANSNLNDGTRMQDCKWYADNSESS